LLGKLLKGEKETGSHPYKNGRNHCFAEKKKKKKED